MPRRFRRASRVTAATPEGEIELVMARGPWLRLIGLMCLDPEQVRPLLFERCRSVHTFWMRTPIDVVWLELASDVATVLGVSESVPPRRGARAPARANGRLVAALELVAGGAAELGLMSGVRTLLSLPKAQAPARTRRPRRGLPPGVPPPAA